MTPEQRNHLLAIVENIYPQFYPHKSYSPEDADDWKLQARAKNPNATPKDLLKAVTLFPYEVWSNPSLMLIALEEPGIFRKIKERYEDAMKEHKQWEKARTDTKLNAHEWFQHIIQKTAATLLTKDYSKAIDEMGVYSDTEQWPDPLEWEWNDDWEDFETAYFTRFGRNPEEKVTKKFFEAMEKLLALMVDFKKKYASKGNTQSSILAIAAARQRWNPVEFTR